MSLAQRLRFGEDCGSVVVPPIADCRAPMYLRLVRTASLLAVVTLAIPAHADPIEPNAGGTYCRVKSPGQQMKFTEGLPFRILADGLDAAGYQWMSGRSVAATVRFYVDGTMAGSANQIA